MDSKLSIAKVVKLMRECEKHRAFLKFGNLIIDCRASDKTLQVTSSQARGSAKKAKEIAEKTEFQEQFNIATEIAETLHLEDPSAFEKMLIQGELGEEKDH